MSDHTPGPWRAERLCIEAPDGNVALCNLARANEADAQLIATAPELLAGLKHLSRGNHEWPTPVTVVAFIERLIAKAERE